MKRLKFVVANWTWSALRRVQLYVAALERIIAATAAHVRCYSTDLESSLDSCPWDRDGVPKDPGARVGKLPRPDP